MPKGIVIERSRTCAAVIKTWDKTTTPWTPPVICGNVKTYTMEIDIETDELARHYRKFCDVHWEFEEQADDEAE